MRKKIMMRKKNRFGKDSTQKIIQSKNGENRSVEHFISM